MRGALQMAPAGSTSTATDLPHDTVAVRLPGLGEDTMTTHSQHPVTGLRREEEGKDPDRKFEKERDDGHEHDRDRRREHDHEHQPEHEHEERHRPDHPSEARV